jgi:hypothetical protein
VADVVRWLAGHADAFRLISFQPIAQVGRTEDGFGGGVSVEALWDRVAEGLGVAGGAARMARMGVWFGHQACNRMVNGVVVRGPDGPPRYHAIRDAEDPLDVRVVDGFLQRFGGVSFRLDSKAELAARCLGIARRAPGFVLGSLGPFARHWLRRVGAGSALRGARLLATKRATATPLVLVSHHFMSREELETPLGRERLAHCVFQVPVDGELVSMCEVNALGVRERYYAQLTRRGKAARAEPAEAQPA